MTQRNLDEKVKQLGANNAWGAQHAHVAVNNDLQYVRGIEKSALPLTITEGYEWSGNYADDYKEWAGTPRKEVNHMVQRCEMKKAADAYARATVNKTGVLNTQRLHQYKLTDDIFLRQTVTPDGKNHGLVMYVGSGSMSVSRWSTSGALSPWFSSARRFRSPSTCIPSPQVHAVTRTSSLALLLPSVS